MVDLVSPKQYSIPRFCSQSTVVRSGAPYQFLLAFRCRLAEPVPAGSIATTSAEGVHQSNLSSDSSARIQAGGRAARHIRHIPAIDRIPEPESSRSQRRRGGIPDGVPRPPLLRPAGGRNPCGEGPPEPIAAQYGAIPKRSFRPDRRLSRPSQLLA